ncbi:MAG: hypothetical protein ACFFCW_46960 [Candidatus Hodarchaeota archaeon]
MLRKIIIFFLFWNTLLSFAMAANENSDNCIEYQPPRITVSGVLQPIKSDPYNESFTLVLERSICIPKGVNPINKDKEQKYYEINTNPHGPQQLEILRTKSGGKITLDGVIFFSNEGEPSLQIVEIIS